MTTTEFKNILIENSPFKIKGTDTELITFKEDSIFINDKYFENIIISKTEYGFSIQYSKGLMPFYENLKIEIPDNSNFPTLINYDEQKLKNDKFRNVIAEDGFLILIKAK